jgi:hypothetical protein
VFQSSLSSSPGVVAIPSLLRVTPEHAAEVQHAGPDEPRDPSRSLDCSAEVDAFE